MADYDPKSIPILDDVIDNITDTDNTEKTEPQDSPAAASETVVDNNLELFTADPVVIIEEETEDDVEEEQDNSALIDYSSNNSNNNEDNELKPAETAPDTSINIDQLVEDIVSNIVPDMEQQLRSMVRRALEEKLPKPPTDD